MAPVHQDLKRSLLKLSTAAARLAIAVRYAAEEWAEARHILYVPGNHEYYGTDIDRGRKQLAEECYSLGITLLDPDAIAFDDVHFIGRRCGPTFCSMASPKCQGTRTDRDQPSVTLRHASQGAQRPQIYPSGAAGSRVPAPCRRMVLSNLRPLQNPSADGRAVRTRCGLATQVPGERREHHGAADNGRHARNLGKYQPAPQRRERHLQSADECGLGGPDPQQPLPPAVPWRPHGRHRIRPAGPARAG